MAMNVAPFQSTDEFSMAGFNGKISDINSGVNNEITSALSGFARIETGSYVGTGKYGQANPNTLTFGFKPKMVFMTDGANSFDDRYTLFFPWLESITALNINRPNQNKYALRTTISGNTIIWFNGTSADFQWNTANHKYCYLVIG